MTAVTPASFSVPVDEITVARARAGDESALEALFRRFETPVYTLARRLTGSTHDAEDVLQETFLEVVRSIRRFRGDGSLAGWIRKVAASKAFMRLRRRSSRGEEELPDDLADPAWASPGGGAPAAAVDRVDLEAALAQLPATTRAVIWLHDVEGYSHDEIAVMAGRTASFSKSQLARAHARLRELLAPGVREGACT
jgi:RNA polymerase sigma-70 factor (ECF subfamily)